jgi:hypothetical protein
VDACALAGCPEPIRQYYVAVIGAFERFCGQELLELLARRYRASTDPRKRFTFRRACLTMRFEAEHDGVYLSVRRSVSLRDGAGHTAKRSYCEVFRLSDGCLIPLTHFTGKHPRPLTPAAGRHARLGRAARRNPYFLHNGAPVLVVSGREIPLKRLFS